MFNDLKRIVDEEREREKEVLLVDQWCENWGTHSVVFCSLVFLEGVEWRSAMKVPFSTDDFAVLKKFFHLFGWWRSGHRDYWSKVNRRSMKKKKKKAIVWRINESENLRFSSSGWLRRCFLFEFFYFKYIYKQHQGEWQSKKWGGRREGRVVKQKR